MDQNELNEDPAPDFEELGEDWITPDLITAVNELQEQLYTVGASVNGIEIRVPYIPGGEISLNSDYGTVKIVSKDVI